MTTLEQNFLEAATKYCREHSTDCNYNKQIDWEQRRYEIAKDALVGVLAAPIVPGMDPNLPSQKAAQWSVEYADALIEELKK